MRRRKTSGGQALVMITFSLLAMCGMMGLAVDLGWSFFVEKQAQAAADAGALGAVEEALGRLQALSSGSVTGFTCASGGQGLTQVECASQESCSSVAANSNLNNGCKYALKNGFDWTNSRQQVTVQSGDAATSPSPSSVGVKNLSYLVTVRTTQTIPQLFSSVLGNGQGVVSAVATAAIAGTISPGSFIGLNRRGDCLTQSNGSKFNCGLDVDEEANGNGIPSCGGGAGTMSLCAPAGIILASSCNVVAANECSDAYAGYSKGGAWASSLTVMASGAVSGNWTPSTPTSSTNPSTFADPSAPNSQPPLMTNGSNIGTCQINHANNSPANITGTVGPFLYYGYNTTTGTRDGVPINVNGTVTFSPTANCPAGAVQTGSFANQTNSSFPTYIFYGGLNNPGTINLGPGQYVMAGTNSTAAGATVFSGGGTIQPDSNQPAATNTGTMFIFTDSQYPGLNLNTSTFPALNQGTLDFKNSNITMGGLVGSANTTSNLPASMDAYSGYVWWQDRRNSTVGYDEPNGSPGCSGGDCTGDNGSVIYCNDSASCNPNSTPAKLATMTAANHVTNTSPGLTMDPGNGNIALSGVFYQPRGAWMEFVHGTTGFTCGSGKTGANCPLQVVTGAAIFDTGDTAMVLQGPSNPIIKYKAVLIQ